MTARVQQAPVLALVDTAADARVHQSPVLVLWGTASSVQASQLVLMWLGRINPRRTIGITD